MKLTRRPAWVSEEHCALGECPLHDPETGDLYWIDIAGAAVYRLRNGRASDGAVSRYAFARPLASIFLAAPRSLLVAGRSGFFLLNTETEAIQPLQLHAPIGEEERYNDGRCDSAGRVWISTMDRRASRPIGSIASFAPGRPSDAVQAYASIGNGICFSPDESWMYFSDSAARAIYRYPASDRASTLGPRERFIELDAAPGRPDGCTVDSEGCLWSARIGGNRVDRYTPDGKLVDYLEIPTGNPTHCTFGGPGLTTLYVTTSRMTSRGIDADADPLAGRMLAFELNISGLPEHRVDADFLATVPHKETPHEQ